MLQRGPDGETVNANAIKNVCYIGRYNVLYNRVKKNANSNTMVLWNYILNSRMDAVIATTEAAAHAHAAASATHLPALILFDITNPSLL